MLRTTNIVPYNSNVGQSGGGEKQNEKGLAQMWEWKGGSRKGRKGAGDLLGVGGVGGRGGGIRKSLFTMYCLDLAVKEKMSFYLPREDWPNEMGVGKEKSDSPSFSSFSSPSSLLNAVGGSGGGNDLFFPSDPRVQQSWRGSFVG